MEWPGPLVRPRPRRCGTVRVRPCLATRAICAAVNVGKICSEREAVSGSGVFGSAMFSYSRNCQTSTATQAEPEDLLGLLAWHIILLNSCAARPEARPRRVGGRTVRFWEDCRGSLLPR